MHPPPLTPELVERLEYAALNKGRAAFLHAVALPDNPYGVSIFEQHGLLAYRVRSLPDLPWYKSIVGINDTNLNQLEAALALFTHPRVAPTLVTWATRLTPKIGAALFDLGFAPRGVGTTLYIVAQHLEKNCAPEVLVRELLPDEDRAMFESVLLGGYGFTNPVQRAFAVLENNLLGVRRYLATIDGQPAAVATMTEQDGVAYLAGAATLPEWRGRGAQTALIGARLADAAQSNELVVVTTAFASPSQYNLERSGFRVAQIKTMWGLRNEVEPELTGDLMAL
jgi:ribosomal protein S18 acetylase RimI-like enzyme